MTINISDIPCLDLFKALYEFASEKKSKPYVVGGTVRDIILHRNISDIDLSLHDSMQFAKEFGDRIKGITLIFNDHQLTSRVIIQGSDLYVDLSDLRGTDIIEDLSKRDFTINSMAIDLIELMSRGSCNVIDPYGGIADMEHSLIRVISKENLIDDPLRMIRAFRFASILEFNIDIETERLICELSSLIATVSNERIRDELFRILYSCNSAEYLKLMDKVGLLEQIFPEINEMKNTPQNYYHDLNVWEHSVLTMELFEQHPVPEYLSEYSDHIERYLSHELVKGRSRMTLLKLVVLFHDVGKPGTQSVASDGRIRFFEHYLHGEEIAKQIGARLKLARREINFVTKVIKYHMYPLFLCNSLKASPEQDITSKGVRKFIYETGDEWLPILLISDADIRATKQGKDSLIYLAKVASKIANAYFNESAPLPPPLITGKDVMNEFNLAPGPIIGKILKHVRKSQLNGELQTKEEALELASKMVKDMNKRD